MIEEQPIPHYKNELGQSIDEDMLSQDFDRLMTRAQHRDKEESKQESKIRPKKKASLSDILDDFDDEFVQKKDAQPIIQLKPPKDDKKIREEIEAMELVIQQNDAQDPSFIQYELQADSS